MTVDPASIKLRFPELACGSDDRIQMFIDDAIIILNPVYWGEKYDLGISYLTAHFITLANKTEAGSTAAKSGPVSSRSVDGASVTYATPTINDLSDAYYSSTPYGLQYLNLRNRLGVAAFVI